MERFRRGDAQFKTGLAGGKNPGVRHIAGAIADERDYFASNGPALFLEGEDVRQDLARVLVVRKGVNGGDLGVAGEFLDVALGEGAEHGAVDHAAQDAGGVLDGFAAAKLDFAGWEENDLAAQLADADLEGDAGARGGFGE